MIRFFDDGDRLDVILLWQEAFGGKEEEAALFLDFLKDNMLVLEKDGQIISMLTLLDVQIGEENGRYVYAVATGKRFRKNGYATELIEYAKQFSREKGKNFLVLVPESSTLFDFYKKRGFCELCCTKKIEKNMEFAADNKIKMEFLSAKEYFDLRDEFFSGKRYVKWDVKTLEFMKKAYRGEFVALNRDDVLLASAFCYKMGDKLVISELLSFGYAEENIDALGGIFGVKSVLGIKAEKSAERFGMIYPKEYSDAYFGLAMK